jgi:hypothetical protein
MPELTPEPDSTGGKSQKKSKGIGVWISVMIFDLIISTFLPVEPRYKLNSFLKFIQTFNAKYKNKIYSNLKPKSLDLDPIESKYIISNWVTI